MVGRRKDYWQGEKKMVVQARGNAAGNWENKGIYARARLANFDAELNLLV